MDDDELERDFDAFFADEITFGDDGESVEPPTNVDQANAMLRRLSSTQREIDRVLTFAAEQRAKIETWAEDRTAGARREIDRLNRALEGWMRGVHEAEPRRKSVNLPFGTVKLTSHRQLPKVIGGEAFELWALANKRDTLLKTERKPIMDAIGKATKAGPKLDNVTDGGVEWERWQAVDAETGEPIPGVEYRREVSDSFKANPS
jgi:phage host-nuclease inhibitor protein Gam